MRNNSQVLGMYDEMSVMYGELDAYKHQGSRLDRSSFWIFIMVDLGLETLRTRTKQRGPNNLQNARLTLVSIAVRCSIIGSRRSKACLCPWHFQPHTTHLFLIEHTNCINTKRAYVTTQHPAYKLTLSDCQLNFTAEHCDFKRSPWTYTLLRSQFKRSPEHMTYWSLNKTVARLLSHQIPHE